MQLITSTAELKASIQQLEEMQAVQGQLLKEQFGTTFESLKPSNIIKSLGEDIASSGLIENMLSTSLGLTVGYYSKRLLIGSSGNPFKKLLGNILQLGVVGIINKNPLVIKSIGQTLLHSIFNKKEADF